MRRQFDIIFDPMAAAYSLAMAGLSEAVKDEDLRRDLRSYEEYVMMERNGSVSGPKAV